MLNNCKWLSSNSWSSTIITRNCLIKIIHILCIIAIVLLLLPGSQRDAPTASDAALIAIVPCWKLRISFQSNNLWRLTHIDTKSQKFRCTPVLHNITMPLATASAVCENVWHELHLQEPVWRLFCHRQSFFRTWFRYPFQIILLAWCLHANSPAAEQTNCFAFELSELEPLPRLKIVVMEAIHHNT